MKKRETRIKVSLGARMRQGDGWTDVRIQNLSSRGLMASAEAEVKPDSYVEVRRGDRIIIGRIVWSSGKYFGLRTQDIIDFVTFVGDPALQSGARNQSGASTLVERRSRKRLDVGMSAAQQADRSRAVASAVQFAAVGIVSVAGCVAIAMAVGRLFAGVTGAVGASLGG